MKKPCNVHFSIFFDLRYVSNFGAASETITWEHMQILLPHLEPLSEQQRLDVGNLAQSCQQAEDALSQGMERLHQILGEAIAKQLGQGNFLPQVGAAIEKLDDLTRFVGQVIPISFHQHCIILLIVIVLNSISKKLISPSRPRELLTPRQII